MSRTWNNDSFNIVEREKSEKGEKKNKWHLCYHINELSYYLTFYLIVVNSKLIQIENTKNI